MTSVMASAILEGRSKELEGKEVSAEGVVGPSEVGAEMLAAAEQEKSLPAEGEAALAEAKSRSRKSPNRRKWPNFWWEAWKHLAGDAETVAVIADELATEKVERIRTKRVRDDKP